MNHIYRVVFNCSLGVYQCVSEIAKSGGKSSGRSAISGHPSSLVLSALSVAILSMSALSAQATTYNNNSTTTVATNPYVITDDLIENTNTIVETRSVTVAETGTGTLTIRNGGQLDNDGTFTIASQSTAVGSATVTGTNSTLKVGEYLDIGLRGKGSVTVAEKGSIDIIGSTYIGSQTSSVGDLTVTGAGSTFNAGSELTIADRGKGSATVAQGGAITAGETYIAFNRDSEGDLTVTGAGSTFNAGSSLRIGNGGKGDATVAEGGAITAGQTYIGNDRDSEGGLTVKGADSIFNAGSLLAIGNGGKGDAKVAQGAAITAGQTYIGRNSSSEGTLTLTGADSIFNTNSMSIGDGGKGDATVAEGGAITAGQTYIGNDTGSVGTLTVTGADSIFNAGSELTIGNSGKGSATVEQGATITAGDTVIGFNPVGEGDLTVKGLSSILNTDFMVIGFRGEGSATVEQGSVITVSENTFIGYDPRSKGNLTVTGAGSTFKTSDLSIGFRGKGSATVAQGAAITASGDTIMSVLPNGEGTLTITGINSTLSTNQLIVGNKGSGTLTIRDNGRVIASNVARRDAQSSAINFDNGTLALTGNLDQFSPLFSRFEASDTINLGAGGGTIDTNEFDIAVSSDAIISGDGSLTKQGTGILTMNTATNKAWTGGTTISQGTLRLTGDYTMADGEVLGIGLNSTDDTSPDNGKLNVVGIANLSAGRLRVDVSQAVLSSTGSPTWDGVITADSIVGEFANTNNIDDNSPLVSFKAEYTPLAVNLTMVKAITPPVVTPPVVVPPVVIIPPVVPPVVNTTFVQSVNSQRNQAELSLASVLDRAIDDRVNNGNNPLADQLIVSTLNFNSSQLAGFANQLQPLAMGATNRIITDTNYAVSDILSTHQPVTASRNLWAQVIGSQSNHDADNGITGYDTDSYGAVVGLDLPMGNQLNLGVAVSYSDTDIDTDNSALDHELNAKSLQVLGYGGYNINDATYINFHAGAGRSDVDGERRLQILGGPVANADYNVDTLQAGLGVDHRIGTALSNITPFAQVHYAQAKRDSYRETGAGVYNLTVDDNRYESMRWTAGLKMSQALTPKIALTGELAAAIENGDKYSDITARFDALPNDTFTTIGQEVGREIGIASLGISYKPTTSTTLSAGYRGEWRDNYEDQGANVALQVSF